MDAKEAVMERIDAIAFTDPSVVPDDAQLERVLGASYEAYRGLLGVFEKRGLTYEWRYYSDGKAWLCKVRKAARTIVWMSAWHGFMKATIYFPEKHVAGIDDLDIPESDKERVRNAANVGKSKPCVFEIRDSDILDTVEAIMVYKIASR